VSKQIVLNQEICNVKLTTLCGKLLKHVHNKKHKVVYEQWNRKWVEQQIKLQSETAHTSHFS